MKVLLYSGVFWPMVGGVETYVRLLALGLPLMEVRGEKVALTLATAAAGATEMPDDQLRIVRTPSLLRLWVLIREADVVMLAGPVVMPLVLALLARRPVVIEHHGYQACCPNGLLLYDIDHTVCAERFLRGKVQSCVPCNQRTRGLVGSGLAVFSTAVRRILCWFAACNICVTEHVQKRIALPRTRVIYHGLPEVSVAGPQRVGSPGHAVVFAYVGRIVSEKGLPLILKASAILKEEGLCFEVRVVGDGPERHDLEALAAELNILDRFSITGFLQGQALSEELAKIDVVVMPSIWEETAGLSAMEHMSRRKLVIVADIGGLGEVVGSGGLKFTAGSVRELAARMREVLADPSIMSSVGLMGGRRAASLFGLDRMIREHAEVFEQVTRA